MTIPEPVDPAALDEGAPPPPSPTVDLMGGDWPKQATEQIVSVVDQVRAKTTGPALQGSRAVVYGLVLAAAASIAGLVGLIGLIRFLNLLTDRPALTYLIIGTVFVLVGAVLWSRREVSPTADRPDAP